MTLPSLRKLPIILRSTTLPIDVKLTVPRRLATLLPGLLLCCATMLRADDAALPPVDSNDASLRPVLESVTPAGTPVRPVSLLNDEKSPTRMTDIRPSLDYAWGDVDPQTLPENFSEVAGADEEYTRVIGPPLLLQWHASNMWYHPLYFEDGPLERYGHTYPACVQNLVSPARFLGQTVLLPYNMAMRPPASREYPLGWYRPGECAPRLKYKPAWNDEAAAHQTLAVVGLVFLIP